MISALRQQVTATISRENNNGGRRLVMLSRVPASFRRHARLAVLCVFVLSASFTLAVIRTSPWFHVDPGAELRTLRQLSLRTMLEFTAHGTRQVFRVSASNNGSVRDPVLLEGRTLPEIDELSDLDELTFSEALAQRRLAKNGLKTPKSRRKTGANSLCPVQPVDLDLHGELSVNLTVPTWSSLERRFPEVRAGGHWEPSDCLARHNVAIVIPYRNRSMQLHLQMQHLHGFLQRQKLNYTIYVVEQTAGQVFNRGLARNVGFLESQRLEPSHECTYFHDVDLLAVDARNMYTCPEQPRHVCTAVNYYENYRPLYAGGYAVFGGVTALRNDHFLEVNGYSNIYIGWGGEDDDLHRRIVKKGLTVFRHPDNVGRYYGVPHPSDQNFDVVSNISDAINRFKMLNLADLLIDADGLNTAEYDVIKVKKEKLYTHIVYDWDITKYFNQAVLKTHLYEIMYKHFPELWTDVKYVPPAYWWINRDVAKQTRRLNDNLKL